MEERDASILMEEKHACWWPGDAKNPDMNSHWIDLILENVKVDFKTLPSITCAVLYFLIAPIDFSLKIIARGKHQEWYPDKYC